MIDLETTALTPERGEILRLYARDLNDSTSTFDQLVKPKRPLSKLVQQITGITNEVVRNAPSLEAAMPEFLDFIDGATLQSTAIDFDMGFLNKSFRMIWLSEILRLQLVELCCCCGCTKIFCRT